jgi:hypothetical protein
VADRVDTLVQLEQETFVQEPADLLIAEAERE